MIVEWFTPPRRSYEWFGETAETLATIASGGTSAVAAVIGPQGGSAYDIAVQEGFTGTEAEWLASLASGGLAVSPAIGNIMEALPDGLAVLTYTHTQSVAAAVWAVDHGLGITPAVTVVDSAGNEVEGSIRHESDNRSVLTFTAPFSGKARFI